MPIQTHDLSQCSSLCIDVYLYHLWHHSISAVFFPPKASVGTRIQLAPKLICGLSHGLDNITQGTTVWVSVGPLCRHSTHLIHIQVRTMMSN